MEIQTWFLFCSVAFIATITPGPAILLAVSHSVAYGLRNTVFTILGNISGLFILSTLSIAGLSVIIFSSAVIFFIVKLLGTVYLLYLGLRLWRKGFSISVKASEKSQSIKNKSTLYLQGFGVAISNPKAIAFTTALFPQFINPQINLLPQFSALLVSFMLLSFSCIFLYAYLAGQTKLRISKSKSSFISKFLGTGFVVSGIALLCTSQKNV